MQLPLTSRRAWSSALTLTVILIALTLTPAARPSVMPSLPLPVWPVEMNAISSGGPQPSPRWRNCRTARCVPAVVRHVFGPRAPYALRIVRCETGGTMSPRATGDGGTSLGIFQIHYTVHPWVNPSRLFDPLYNARMAWRLSRHGTDWTPWTCHRLISGAA